MRRVLQLQHTHKHALDLLRAYVSEDDTDEPDATDETLALIQRSIDAWAVDSPQVPDQRDEQRRRNALVEIQRLCDEEWPPECKEAAAREASSDAPDEADDGALANRKRRLVGETSSPNKVSARSAANEETAHVVVVKPFGSWHYGLHTAASDLDVNLWAAQPIPDFFECLARRLRALSPPVQLVVAERARIPSARFTLRGLQVDVVHECGAASDYEHSLAVTSWVKSWLARFPALTVVARIVKTWAMANNLNKSYHNTLPSLAYLVMLFSVAESLEKQHRSRCFAAALLSAFFHRYADWRRTVRVLRSVRSHSLQEIVRTRDCVASPAPEAYERYNEGSLDGFGETVFIQDPFLRTVNLGRFVTLLTFRRLVAAFRRAVQLCETPSKDIIMRLTGEH